MLRSRASSLKDVFIAGAYDTGLGRVGNAGGNDGDDDEEGDVAKGVL